MVAESWIVLIYHVPAALFGLAVHEFGHAWMAVKMGNRSAVKRMSFNPLVHLETSWALLLLFSGFWLRPFADTYVGRKKAWVAAGGPLLNLSTALLMFVAVFYVHYGSSAVEREIIRFLSISASYQIRFATVNLLPIPPLDGARIMAGLMPRLMGRFMERNETVGLVILILLLVSGSLNVIVESFESLLQIAVGSRLL